MRYSLFSEAEGLVSNGQSVRFLRHKANILNRTIMKVNNGHQSIMQTSEEKSAQPPS